MSRIKRELEVELVKNEIVSSCPKRCKTKKEKVKECEVCIKRQYQAFEEYNNARYTERDDVDKYKSWRYDNNIIRLICYFGTNKSSVAIISKDEKNQEVFEFAETLAFPDWIKKIVQVIKEEKHYKEGKIFKVTIESNGCDHCCVSQGFATLEMIAIYMSRVKRFTRLYPIYVNTYPLVYAPVECVKYEWLG